jgi:predicted phage replisome organizer
MQIVPQWMKLDTNIFSNKKIRKIRRMPEGDSLFTLWIYLICEGMKNIVNPGVIEYSAGIPITFEDIADDCGLKLATVQMGIDIFNKLGMIFPNEGGCVTVKNLSKHQSLERLEYQRDLKNARQQRWREKKKLLELENSEDVGVYKTSRRQTEESRVDKSRIDKNRVEESREEQIREEVTKVTVIDPYSFDEFWNEYDKKIGDKSKLSKKWDKLSKDIKKQIIDYIPFYKQSQPNKQYRKNPETFLNNESWNDELIFKNEHSVWDNV